MRELTLKAGRVRRGVEAFRCAKIGFLGLSGQQETNAVPAYASCILLGACENDSGKQNG